MKSATNDKSRIDQIRKIMDEVKAKGADIDANVTAQDWQRIYDLACRKDGAK